MKTYPKTSGLHK